MKFLSVATLAMVMAFASQAAIAKGDTESQIQDIDLVMQAMGYKESHDEDYDELAEGGVNRSNYSVTKGRSYKVIAVCDSDCDDVDLIVYDRDGNWIEADVEDDATPIVDFTAAYSGKYEVQTKVRKCTTSTCYYRTRVYTKD